MIMSLEGKIGYLGLNYTILEVQGVGYQIYLNAEVLARLKKDQSIKFFIHQYIRENQLDLYGFLTFEELELFELLISVSGIGPKAAQAILSRSKPSQIKSAIMEEDLDIFTAVSGVGRKIATRIILELKGKISAEDLSIALGKNDYAEILEALKNLGYKPNEAKETLKNMPKDLKSDNEKITWALQQLSK